MKVLFLLLLGLSGTVDIASAQDRHYAPPAEEGVHYAWADVLRVDPVYEYVAVTNPRQDCYDERVEHREGRGNNSGSTVLGAVIGGALGNTVGKGDGRKAATIAGAVIGGSIAHNSAKRDDRSYSTTETRCRRVSGGGYEERSVTGYDVEYRYRGEVYASRMNFDPGDRLRVRVSVVPAE
jgi:uncharacterized protein YcfJ